MLKGGDHLSEHIVIERHRQQDDHHPDDVQIEVQGIEVHPQKMLLGQEKLFSEVKQVFGVGGVHVNRIDLLNQVPVFFDDAIGLTFLLNR